MRELKFRTWDAAGKLFEYFDLREIPHGCATCSYTAQQYTGIKDKHGKEIYEGDIVKWMPDAPTGGYNNHLFEVIWYQTVSSSGFKYEIIGGKRPFIQCCGKINETSQDVEIVGNVFENPELLK